MGDMIAFLAVRFVGELCEGITDIVGIFLKIPSRFPSLTNIHEAMGTHASSSQNAAGLIGTSSDQASAAGLSPPRIREEPFGRFCAICLEDIPDEDVVQLPCRHAYHTACIDLWFQRQSLCPMRCSGIHVHVVA